MTEPEDRMQDSPHGRTAVSRRYVRRGCHTVRNRCREFIEILRRSNIKELPLETAKTLFMNTMDIWDRTSIKAYFGSQAHISTKKMQRIARYPSGTVSFKAIELSQQIPQRKGYLELLGLATFELRGKTWFTIVQHESLVPEMGPQHCERNSGLPIANFSLSSISPNKDQVAVAKGVAETHKQTTTHRMRERNQSSESERIPNTHGCDLAPEVEALLKARLLSTEPDRSKTNFLERTA